ncbi:LPS export ABC transporter periplasmic protein LptC [uncultured Shimia sp.]|uniref:LPS export ABC transporter periplasmic protein LptC n=1 Tax=uncultured Shimia sp. TaxID=573152 RepID=UPI00262CC2F5|nr:LPS export ABC transporter periplasmic protein LptC [uncultured Shimia sp.]
MDFYSKIVWAFKIVCLVSAAICLVLLFALKRGASITSSEGGDIDSPFYHFEIGVLNNSVTRGATENGSLFEVFLQKVEVGQDLEGSVATVVNGNVKLLSGRQIEFSAEEGILSKMDSQISLKGEVVVSTLDGSTLYSDLLVVNLGDISGYSPSPVLFESPIGTIESDYMDFSSGESGLLITFSRQVSVNQE